jgi:hypothetical protein
MEKRILTESEIERRLAEAKAKRENAKTPPKKKMESNAAVRLPIGGPQNWDRLWGS